MPLALTFVNDVVHLSPLNERLLAEGETRDCESLTKSERVRWLLSAELSGLVPLYSPHLAKGADLHRTALESGDRRGFLRFKRCSSQYMH